jgi:hypothetical protein
MASNNIPFDDTTKPGNNSNLWVCVDGTTNSDDGCVLERNNGSKQHSDSEKSTLPLVSHSPPRVDKDKRNTTNKLIKKGSSKIVAAIKSLQCSPRVDASDYGKLKETKKNKGSSSNNNNNDNDNNILQSSNHHLEDCSSKSIKTDGRHNLYQQPQQSSHEEPVFVANFDNFANFELMQDQLLVFEKGYVVSNNLELENILVNIDANDTLQIFTTDTNDTEDTIDINDENIITENGQKNEEYDADDNQIIDDLRNTISGLSQNETVTAKIYSSAEVSGRNEADGSTPTSTSSSSSSSSSKPKRLIQNEFSQFSNDSNDTPVTCNKSLILTPNNKERLRYGRKEEQQDSGDDDNDFWCRPPKEVLHTSLSLGDAISPTENDSPFRPDQDQSSDEVSAEPSYGEASKHKDMSIIGRDGSGNGDKLDHDYHRPTDHHSQQHKIETLKLPVMNGRRGGTLSLSSPKENVLRRAQQFEKQQAGGTSYISKYATEKVISNEKKGMSTTPQEDDDASAVSSSYVSSFVFSTADNGHNLDCNANHHDVVANSDPNSPAFFWKTHPREHEERGMQQQKAVNHYAVINSEQPNSPAFFWKTHPRVTIKSYRFQQRKASIRKVNTKLESGRSMLHHTNSA